MTLAHLVSVSIALHSLRPLPTQADLFREAHVLTRASGVLASSTYQATFGAHLRALTAYWKAEVARRAATHAADVEATVPRHLPTQPQVARAVRATLTERRARNRAARATQGA